MRPAPALSSFAAKPFSSSGIIREVTAYEGTVSSMPEIYGYDCMYLPVAPPPGMEPHESCPRHTCTPAPTSGRSSGWTGSVSACSSNMRVRMPCRSLALGSPTRHCIVNLHCATDTSPAAVLEAAVYIYESLGRPMDWTATRTSNTHKLNAQPLESAVIVRATARACTQY